MLGDAVDDLEHTADFLAMAFQLMDDLGGLLDIVRQARDAAAGEADDLPAAGRLAIGTRRRLGGALRIQGDLLDTGGHLVDRGGDQVGFLLLARGALRAALHRSEQLAGVAAQLTAGVGDAPDHGTGFGFQQLHGEGDFTDFVAAAGIEPLADRVMADLACLQRQPLQRRERHAAQYRSAETTEQHAR